MLLPVSRLYCNTIPENIFSQWLSIIKRSIKRKDKISRTMWLVWHVLYKRFQTKNSRLKQGQMTNDERIAPYIHKVIKLTSFKEVDKFVDSL